MGSNQSRYLSYFEQLSAIPRGSGKTDGISAWLCRFAKEHKLPCYRDSWNNVLITVPASGAGYETHPPVILQAHTDMVMAHTEDYDGDMETDGVRLVYEGDRLRADRTTLGADDGIGVAYMLALASDTTPSHPPLELLFTADEEIGLLGAKSFDTTRLRGRRMLNLDSLDEGIFTAGCAGGIRVDLSLQKGLLHEDHPGLVLRLEGLQGGHSGTCIGLGRKNAIKELAELLWDIRLQARELTLSHIQGGTADNAIADFAEATVVTEGVSKEKIQGICKQFLTNLQSTEPGARLVIRDTVVDVIYEHEDAAQILSLIRQCQSGVLSMNPTLRQPVESSQNIGIVRETEDGVCISVSVRSSVAQKKEEQTNDLFALAAAHGGVAHTRGDYPAWEYKKDSPLCALVCHTYRRLFAAEPQVNVIHAGLECGIFTDAIPDLEAISLGPEGHECHTPREWLSLSSAKRYYTLLCTLLEAM